MVRFFSLRILSADLTSSTVGLAEQTMKNLMRSVLLIASLVLSDISMVTYSLDFATAG